MITDPKDDQDTIKAALTRRSRDSPGSQAVKPLDELLFRLTQCCGDSSRSPELSFTRLALSPVYLPGVGHPHCSGSTDGHLGGHHVARVSRAVGLDTLTANRRMASVWVAVTWTHRREVTDVIGRFSPGDAQALSVFDVRSLLSCQVAPVA